ncbi:MAG: SLBB domain-containing protein [Limnochordales bacterium]|nr:SLBB domain-containing protein [Limnochordales bacterium]
MSSKVAGKQCTPPRERKSTRQLAYHILGLFFVLELLLAPVAAAAPATGDTLPAGVLPLPLPGQDATAEYRLGPGDTIQVVVYGQPDLTVELLVGPDGSISYPLLGKVLTAGKTTTELAAEIRAGLTDYVRDPQVTVAVVRYRTLRVQVLGEVRAPGLYQLPLGSRIMDAIGQAGGWTKQAALSRALLVRRGEVSRIDLEKLAATGDASLNLTLEDGDLINIPVAATAVIWGEVKNPGAYTLPPGTTLVELLALAGGPLATADLTRVRLTRGGADGAVQVVDLSSGRGQQGSAGSDGAVRPVGPVVESGDIVYVPAVRSVAVLGAVARPDRYLLQPGETRILDIIARAGGFTAEAATDRVTVTRTTAAGETETIILDLSRASEGSTAGSFLLQADDVIYVPQGRLEVLVLGQVRDPRAYPWRQGMRVLDALAAAGGLTEKANAEAALLFRNPPDKQAGSAAGTSGASIVVNLARLQQAPGDPENWVLQPGDVLFVPEGNRQVAILGEVARPGLYPLIPGMRVLDLVAQAGGPGEWADRSRVTVMRSAKAGHERIIVDLDQAQQDRKLDVTLNAGDLVVVNRIERAVLVLGEVRAPGAYPVSAGTQLLDLVARAGGFTERAAGDRALLTRLDSEGRPGEPQLVRLVDGAQGRPGADAHLLARPGDVLYVPARLESVTILGEVRSPGAYQLRPEMRLLDLLAQAGGPTEHADLGRATLTRQDGDRTEVRRVDLKQLLGRKEAESPAQGAAESDSSARSGGTTATADDNYLLKPGDVLYVPRAAEVVVLGAVRTPGSFALPDGVTLVEALAAAGGPRPEALLSQAMLTLPGGKEATSVDLEEALKNPAGDANLTVPPGAVLFVPEGRQEVTVLGEVHRPGQYSVKPGMTVLDVIGQAGDVTSTASLERVILAREGQEMVVDLDRARLEPASTANPAVRGGDIILVPRAERQVMALGAWNTPRSMPWRPGLRVIDLVAAAGGAKAGADIRKVLLFREAEEGQVEVKTLSLKMLAAPAAGRAGSNGDEMLLLEPGDVLVVAETRPVAVLGEVAKPGYWQLSEPVRLLDVLAMAGGTTPDAATERVVLVRMAQGDTPSQTITVDLRPALQGQPGADNPWVEPGDTVLVPEANRFVLVLGEVNSPRQVAVWPGMRLLEAIAQAGGLTARADLRQVILSQGGKVERIDLQAVLSDPLHPDNRLLEGGAAIVVPRRVLSVVVLGAVRNPGSYVLEEPARLVQALAAAGGPRETADLQRVQLSTTAADDSGVTRTTVVDAAAALANPGDPANLPVRGGDVIFVPEREWRVLVYGEVRSPGAYTIKPGARVLDALALAGGPTDQADLPALLLTRRYQDGDSSRTTQKVVDLAALLRNPGLEANEELEPGDVLYLPPARQVAVLGRVNRPGAYTLPAGARVLDLIALAGGPTQDARVDTITVLRREGEAERLLTVDYAAIIGTGNGQQNIVLQPGDVVYVPEALRQVLVLGEVRNPGLYTIREGMRVMDAIGLAGGPTERAALEAVGIYRGGDPKEAATLALGKDMLVFQGDARENPLIQPGDIIYVPETGKPDWQKIFSFLSGVKLFKDLLGF